MLVAAPALEKLLGEESPAPQTVDGLVLSFPYEGTVSYGEGAAKGPETILGVASEQVEFYDFELKRTPCAEKGIYVYPEKKIKGSSAAAHQKIVGVTKAAVAEHPDAFFVGLGGEHAVTYPFVKGLQESGKIPEGTAVLQIDAHADLREAYGRNPYSHASVMRRLRDDMGMQSVHVGIRAIGDEEPQYIEENNVPIFFAPFSASQIPEILQKLPDNIFITFDVDGLDPSIMPSTGTPVPGGLLWFEALALLRAAFEQKNVVGMDIVELAPIENLHAPDFLAAQLLYKAFAYKFCL